MTHPEPREAARMAFAELLRSRRERLQPAAVGLPVGTRRRTPGLRREEVAVLADLSVTYYTYLEQGRDVQPSREVVEALASALRLDVSERALLLALAAQGKVEAPLGKAETLSPAVEALMASFEPHPTYIKGARWDLLAANSAARILFADWDAPPPHRRNLLWWMFTSPQAREIYVEWEREAAAMLARFRFSAVPRAANPAFRELIEDLHRRSAEMRAWWPQYEVQPVAGGTKRLRHPLYGEQLFRHVVLLVAEDPGQKVVTFSAADESGLRPALALRPAGTLPLKETGELQDGHPCRWG